MVTAMQFDRHGNRLWRDATTLLDSQHARYAIGAVAVPYGTCGEPSNVKAGGGACPVCMVKSRQTTWDMYASLLRQGLSTPA